MELKGSPSLKKKKNHIVVSNHAKYSAFILFTSLKDLCLYVNTEENGNLFVVKKLLQKFSSKASSNSVFLVFEQTSMSGLLLWRCFTVCFVVCLGNMVSERSHQQNYTHFHFSRIQAEMEHYLENRQKKSQLICKKDTTKDFFSS